MVKWEGSPIPAPYIYYRTSSSVAFADICAPGDILDSIWTDVVSCAITVVEAVGVSTVIKDPEAVLGVFESAFKSCLVGKVGGHAELIQVSLSVRHLPDKDWHR
jgi:hypothetical protein